MAPQADFMQCVDYSKIDPDVLQGVFETTESCMKLFSERNELSAKLGQLQNEPLPNTKKKIRQRMRQVKQIRRELDIIDDKLDAMDFSAYDEYQRQVRDDILRMKVRSVIVQKLEPNPSQFLMQAVQRIIEEDSSGSSEEQLQTLIDSVVNDGETQNPSDSSSQVNALLGEGFVDQLSEAVMTEIKKVLEQVDEEASPLALLNNDDTSSPSTNSGPHLR